jgi:heat shock protein 4
MDEIRAMAGPIVQRHFEKVEAHRQAVQAKLEADRAKKAAEAAEARKAAEAEKAQNGKDEEMTDADAPKAEVDEAGDP